MSVRYTLTAGTMPNSMIELSCGQERCNAFYDVSAKVKLYRIPVEPQMDMVGSIHGLDWVELGWVKNFQILLGWVRWVEVKKSRFFLRNSTVKLLA